MKKEDFVKAVNKNLPFDEKNVDMKPVNNADKIRAMSVDELARFLFNLVDANYVGVSVNWFLKWLLKECD